MSSIIIFFILVLIDVSISNSNGIHFPLFEYEKSYFEANNDYVNEIARIGPKHCAAVIGDDKYKKCMDSADREWNSRHGEPKEKCCFGWQADDCNGEAVRRLCPNATEVFDEDNKRTVEELESSHCKDYKSGSMKCGVQVFGKRMALWVLITIVVVVSVVLLLAIGCCVYCFCCRRR